MTAAGVQSSPSGAVPAPAAAWPAVAWLRLARLYAVSRRVPAALGLLAALGCLLWAALYWRWNIAGGPAAQQFFSLAIETGAAAVIAVTTYGPFGEPERATGRWLPWLRLAAALALTAAAFGALAAGATGGTLPGGTLALLRDLAGLTGTGLLAAAVLGGAFGWAGPMAYLLITEEPRPRPGSGRPGPLTTSARRCARPPCSPPGSWPSRSSAPATPAAGSRGTRARERAAAAPDRLPRRTPHQAGQPRAAP
jgi:hypothetical protein